MKIVYKAVGAPPMVRIIPNSIEAMERLIGGDVEAKSVGDGLMIVYAKGGEGLGLDAHLVTEDYEMLYGDAFIVASEDFSAFQDLEPDEVREAVALLEEMEL